MFGSSIVKDDVSSGEHGGCIRAIPSADPGRASGRATGPTNASLRHHRQIRIVAGLQPA